jgi:predicted metal-dependent hydrolase
MNKGERISQFVRELGGDDVDLATVPIERHPFYRAYFRCWNEQHYYEAHDVLEHIWLKMETGDAIFFKGLIQAAGAFVHLQKNFEQPAHPKHSRRLRPAVRLFQLAENNLAVFQPQHFGLDVNALCEMLRSYVDRIVRSDYQTNPWSPETAPRLELLSREN